MIKSLAELINVTGNTMITSATAALVVSGAAKATSVQVIEDTSDEGKLRVANALHNYAVTSTKAEAQLLAIGLGVKLLGRGVKKLVESR